MEALAGLWGGNLGGGGMNPPQPAAAAAAAAPPQGVQLGQGARIFDRYGGVQNANMDKIDLFKTGDSMEVRMMDYALEQRKLDLRKQEIDIRENDSNNMHAIERERMTHERRLMAEQHSFQLMIANIEASTRALAARTNALGGNGPYDHANRSFLKEGSGRGPGRPPGTGPNQIAAKLEELRAKRGQKKEMPDFLRKKKAGMPFQPPGRKKNMEIKKYAGIKSALKSKFSERIRNRLKERKRRVRGRKPRGGKK